MEGFNAIDYNQHMKISGFTTTHNQVTQHATLHIYKNIAVTVTYIMYTTRYLTHQTTQRTQQYYR